MTSLTPSTHDKLTKRKTTKPPMTTGERQKKRKSEFTTAAKLNGFQNWSEMFTFIKNKALEGKAVINKE